jgi:hypothetical protein
MHPTLLNVFHVSVRAFLKGDPHLAGAHGITFDVYGKPAANYSLLVAPAFEVNMQLADRGPEMRFMTSMAVLYKVSLSSSRRGPSKQTRRTDRAL